MMLHQEIPYCFVWTKWVSIISIIISCIEIPIFAQEQTMTVSVVPAQQREVARTLRLVGSVEPYIRSLIASELDGLVEKITVEEGDRIEAGKMICKLRDTTRQIAYAEAQAQMKRLEAELSELEAGTRKEELDRAKAAVAEAQAVFKKWELELKRITDLREGGSASLKEFNDTTMDFSAARERLAQMKAQYDLAVAGPRQEDIEQARFKVEAQRSIVERLKYYLDQTVIKAPFSGYVSAKHTEIGQWVTVGGPVVELIDLDRVLIQVDVPESAINAIEVGEFVAIEIQALNKELRGEIKHKFPQAHEDARTFPVEIELDNKSHELWSGMFARARVPAGPIIDSVIVPRDAVIQRENTYFVVTVGPAPPPAQGNFGMPVPVILGADVGDWVAIQSPMIREGMPVAVKGHDRIYGPMPVKMIPVKIPGPTKAATRPASTMTE